MLDRLDSKTITNKYSVTDYAIIYLGSRQPSTTVKPNIRYCVEESAGVLCHDKNHETIIFESEAQAFEFRQILGFTLPVLAFYAQALPDWDASDTEESLDAPEFADVDVEEAIA
ncbi:MAG: hypothetical protein AB7C98_01090 [Acidithiobacillus sp.]|jgi:hypothetical protein